MKHILLPTDFSIRSLQPVHDIMHHFSQDTVKITLMHLVCMPTGISDLLFRTQKFRDRYPVPEAFLDACEVMSNRYGSRLSSIRPLIRPGETRAYLENMLCGMNVDAVFIQPGFKEESAFRDSIPVTPLLRRCNFPVIETAPIHRSETSNASTVGDLLLAAG